MDFAMTAVAGQGWGIYTQPFHMFKPFILRDENYCRPGGRARGGRRCEQGRRGEEKEGEGKVPVFTLRHHSSTARSRRPPSVPILIRSSEISHPSWILKERGDQAYWTSHDSGWRQNHSVMGGSLGLDTGYRAQGTRSLGQDTGSLGQVQGP